MPDADVGQDCDGGDGDDERRAGCRRELELDALINSVIDVARLTGVATPYLEVASACAGLLNRRVVDDGVAFAPAAIRKQILP